MTHQEKVKQEERLLSEAIDRGFQALLESSPGLAGHPLRDEFKAVYGHGFLVGAEQWTARAAELVEIARR